MAKGSEDVKVRGFVLWEYCGGINQLNLNLNLLPNFPEETGD